MANDGEGRRADAEAARLRNLEDRLAHVQSSLASVTAQNERLVRTLKDAREQIVTLKAEVDRLAQPPSGYGTVLEAYDDGTGSGGADPADPTGSTDPTDPTDPADYGERQVSERTLRRRVRAAGPPNEVGSG